MVLSLSPPPAQLYKAAKHYKYLLDKGFKREYTLRVIGDKYTLNKYNRLILYRSIHSSEHVKSIIRKKIYYDMMNEVLYIDFYNVLITLSAMVKKDFLYLGNDNFLRDMSGVHGRLRDEKKFTLALNLFNDFLSHCSAKKIIIYLESQVSKSGEYASIVRRLLKERGVVYLDKNVDTKLSSCKGIIGTSDSIIHQNALKLIDIPRSVSEYTDLEVKAIDFSYIR